VRHDGDAGPCELERDRVRIEAGRHLDAEFDPGGRVSTTIDARSALDSVEIPTSATTSAPTTDMTHFRLRPELA